MGRTGVETMLILMSLAAVIVFVLVPFWQIFKKAGFPPALCFFMIVPMINLVMLYFLAFAKWPSMRNS